MPEHLEAITRDVKSLLAQMGNELRIQFVNQLRVVSDRQIAHLIAIHAAEMIMGLVMAVESSGAVAGCQLLSKLAIDQGFQGLVHGGETDFGKPAPDGLVYVLRRGMGFHRTQVIKHGRPLPCASPAGLFQCTPQPFCSRQTRWWFIRGEDHIGVSIYFCARSDKARKLYWRMNYLGSARRVGARAVSRAR